MGCEEFENMLIDLVDNGCHEMKEMQCITDLKKIPC